MFWLISLSLQFYLWPRNTLAAAGSCKTWFYLFQQNKHLLLNKLVCRSKDEQDTAIWFSCHDSEFSSDSSNQVQKSKEKTEISRNKKKRFGTFWLVFTSIHPKYAQKKLKKKKTQTNSQKSAQSQIWKKPSKLQISAKSLLKRRQGKKSFQSNTGFRLLSLHSLLFLAFSCFYCYRVPN